MSSRDCIACFKPVADDGRFMKCVACQHVYHLGQSCAGIAESTFTTMGPAKREKWKCRTCRSNESRSTSSSSQVTDPPGVLSQLNELNEKLDTLMSIRDNVNALMGLPSKVDELLSLKPAVDQLRSTVAEVQASIDFLSNKYDSLLQKASANEQTIREMETETASLKATVSEHALAINRLREELNEAEQYSRLPNLEISGMPVLPNENLIERVGDLAVKLGISDFQASDILAAHRLQSKKDQTPVVIIRFISAQIKERWFRARTMLRSLFQEGTLPKLFLNENLTRANRELFWLARSRSRERNYKFTWVRSGKIFAKKHENAPLVRINRHADLDKIV